MLDQHWSERVMQSSPATLRCSALGPAACGILALVPRPLINAAASPTTKASPCFRERRSGTRQGLEPPPRSRTPARRGGEAVLAELLSTRFLSAPSRLLCRSRSDHSPALCYGELMGPAAVRRHALGCTRPSCALCVVRGRPQVGEVRGALRALVLRLLCARAADIPARLVHVGRRAPRAVLSLLAQLELDEASWRASCIALCCCLFR